MKKAIIFDLDGTAIDSPVQKLPTKELIEVIQKLKNKYYFSAATGRGWTFAKQILQALKLTDPCVISAGTQICDPVNGKILWKKIMNKKSLHQAVDILKQYPEYKLLCNEYSENDYLCGGINVKDFQVNDPVHFLEQIFVPDKIAPVICNKLNKIDGIICVMVVAQKPGMRDLHIINKTATKEHTIGVLLKLLNVSKIDTIGIGDGHNDIHLFNAVHHKIAMGNSVPELKAIADKIIGSVKEDGLTEYLKTISDY